MAPARPAVEQLEKSEPSESRTQVLVNCLEETETSIDHPLSNDPDKRLEIRKYSYRKLTIEAKEDLAIYLRRAEARALDCGDVRAARELADHASLLEQWIIDEKPHWVPMFQRTISRSFGR